MNAAALLQWFAAHRRVLPWRREPRDPWAVLVSELMLQQTQVERVAERFPAFLARFPDPSALAAVSEEEVVREWSGLGYYRRARALHRLARELAPGGLPVSAAELERLPGVGPYTAAAVASLAHGEAVPLLDGNVLRVGARVLELTGDPRTGAARRRILAWVRELHRTGTPGAVNEALMELGALVCTPASPRCHACPLAPVCSARAAGRQGEIPPPRRRRAAEALRWIAVCAEAPSGRWLLRRVEGGPILRGLWLPPFAAAVDGEEVAAAALRLLPSGPVGPLRRLAPVRHGITFRRLTVEPVLVRLAEHDPAPGWRWADPRAPGLPTSSLLAKLVAAAD